MKILVAYATNSGTTTEVAQAVAEELNRGGHQAEVARLAEVANLEAYQAVVLGAPMIVGWHRAARSFLKKHRQALTGMPVALFMTAMSLTQTSESQLDGIPLVVDGKLAQAPARAGRLTFKERYTTPGNYLRPVLKAAPQVRPVSVAMFGGRLDIYRLKWWQALFVMLVIQAAPGDRRNWDAIRTWAAELFS